MYFGQRTFNFRSALFCSKRVSRESRLSLPLSIFLVVPIRSHHLCPVMANYLPFFNLMHSIRLVYVQVAPPENAICASLPIGNLDCENLAY